MTPVKFGLIGCGRNASFHLSASRGNPKLQFSAAFDPDLQNLNRFCKRNKLAAREDLQGLLTSDVDAVLITVPHYLHAPLVIAAAEAGKHVLCEKPMANSLEECDRMIAAAGRAGVKFMVAENHRFLPAHAYLKEAVSRGLIGDVFLGRSYEGAFDNPEKIKDPHAWMFSWDRGGGGALHDQGAHKFALWNWLLGEVESAMCLCSKALASPPVKAEDTAVAILRYRSGALVEVTVSTATVHVPTNRIELHGTRGSMLEDHDWEKPVKVYSTREEAEHKCAFWSPELEHGAFPLYYTISFRIEVDHFADCIRNDTPPAFTPEEAREAVAVSHLAYFAAKNARLTTMAEFREFIAANGTRALFEGLERVPSPCHENLRW